ncbi:hypothetical protein G6F66_015447 [Rhizopus arrhizus]|nr:hypothetical protein G6F66_015447 [Rhizopus arrhizus]
MPVCECTSLGVAMRADSIGIRLTATRHAASSETEMVIAICDMKMLMLLVSPNRFGTNTMQWHNVPALSAMATLRVPMIEASRGCPGMRSRSW